MAYMSTQGASSSSTPAPQWKFDVFLNFRGEDTRKGFTDHLHAALQRKGIVTFRDDEKLERGKPISQELLKAIEESRFAIVIFSRNYASSTWCLDELTKIFRRRKEMKMTVLPIFYDVDPSDVRNQTGTFKEAFAKHEDCFKENIEKVKTWREALREVAYLSGWHLQDRHESEFIQQIVENISHKLSSSFSSITNGLVGIDSSVEELIPSYLGFGNNVYMIGICGMGGLGKTTLARVVYDKYRSHFEGSSFIANVREESEEKHGLRQLQQQLLEEILGEWNIKIRNVDNGVGMIKTRLCHKKVLIVLDDVDKLNQLEKLVGEHDWFGLGSWIIITTRHEHLLVQHGVHKRYKPSALCSRVAQTLFCLKAFKNEQPRDGYMQLSKYFVEYANGLPLALVTLGSFLVGKTMDEWQSALAKFKKIPKVEIFDILKVSYDGLDEMEREIFLDIACFFRGETKGRVIFILENCGFDARIGISVLIDKSLITIENKELRMHDLLQDMGREIVRRESRGEPGKRSRLYLCEDLFHVLTKDMATEAIQAIVLDFYGKEGCWNFEAFPKPFSKMCNLRLLRLGYVQIPPNALDHVSNNLRFLEWNWYSSKFLPSSFQPKELVELNLQHGKIEYLWEGVKYLDKLKFINLHDSRNLVQTPDFIGFPSLERLWLSNCINLVEVHPSIGQLRRLVVLNLEGCRSLTNFPSITTEMQSLTILYLRGCSKISEIPEFKGIMKSLSELYLGETAIERLPSSIECLTALTILNLEGCKNLRCLPSNMDSLRSLEKLVLSDCSGLANLPENFWKIKCLKELNLSGISQLEGRWLNGIAGFSSLKSLKLRLNSFVTLPASISQLSELEVLDLSGCRRLQSLPKLPSTVRYINSDGCQGGRHYSNFIVAFTILIRYLQGLLSLKAGHETSSKRKEDGSGAEFQIIIPGHEISHCQCLTHHRMGNSIHIKLPPNWCNSRWMGFALCVCLHNAFGVRTDVKAHVITYGYIPHSRYTFKMFSRLISCDTYIWLSYLSRDSWLATVRNGEYCSQIGVSFEADKYGGWHVLECGVRLVYEQDVEELNQIIAHAEGATSLLDD